MKVDYLRKSYERGGTSEVFSSVLDQINRRFFFDKLAKLRRQRYQTLSGYNAVAEPFKILWVSPEVIKYVTYSDEDNEYIVNPKERVNYKSLPKDNPYHQYVIRGSFEPHKHIGRIVDGNWDEKKTEFESLIVYEGLESRFKYGVDWEETDYFKMMTERMKNGYLVRGCSTPEQYKKKCDDIQQIYHSIEKNGLFPKRVIDNKISFEEIGVNIGRDGELYFNSEGHHRLSMAKMLELTEIPVIVIVRHKKWQQKREFVKEAIEGNDFSSINGKLINHPDMKDILESS